MGRNFSLYVYASTGYSGIRSTLVEGWFETHPIQPAEIRAFVLLFASLGIVYHGSGLPRISEIPRAICPPSLRGGGIRAHVRIEEPPVRLNIYTRRDKTGLERHSRHSIIWNKSSSHSRRIPVDRRGFHPFEWKFLKNGIDYIIRVYVLCFSLSAGVVGSVERSVDVSFTRS